MTKNESSYVEFPENYIYNKYYFKNEFSSVKPIEINIDDYVYELMQCGTDKKKFKEIMNSVEKKFLDGEDLSSDDEMKINSSLCEGYEKFSSNTRNSKVNEENFSKNSHLLGKITNDKSKYYGTNNYSSNIKPLQSYKNYSERNIISSSNKFVNQNNKNSHNNDKPYIQKKYTDVHANTKFHYPDNYYEDDDELSFDKSQWTDRANTSTFYNRQSTNNSNISNAYYHNYNSEYNANLHKYPNKLNSYFIPNRSMMEDSMRSNRDLNYNLTKKNLYTDDL